LGGAQVTIDDNDSAADIKAKLQAALNDVTNFEVLTNGDTPAVGGLAATASVTAPAAGKFAIVARAGYSVNVTNFTDDGTSAGVKGELNVVGGGNNAKMIDNTNLFEVDNTATTTNAQATINFSSLTSSYNFELDGQAVTITSAQIEAGTAATAIITALNTAAAGSAGGLSSLVGATAPTVDYEVVQNGNTVTITKKGGDDGVMAGAPAGSDDNNIFISDFTATANPAVAATTASYEQNGVAGTSKDLAEVGYGTYTSGQATATKMAVEVSGDATYSFRLTNLAGSGQHTTAITAAVVGGSMATMIAAVNNETAHHRSRNGCGVLPRSGQVGQSEAVGSVTRNLNRHLGGRGLTRCVSAVTHFGQVFACTRHTVLLVAGGCSGNGWIGCCSEVRNEYVVVITAGWSASHYTVIAALFRDGYSVAVLNNFVINSWSSSPYQRAQATG